VEAVEARSGTLPLSERLSGVVRAENQVAIRPEIEAPVVEVWVRSGQAVERGQPLVRLDDSALADQLRQAEAAVRLAEGSAVEARARTTELEAQVVRTRVLAAQDLVSQLELETQEAQLAAALAVAEQAAARVEQARATVAERRNARGKTVVRAPVAGRLGQLLAEVGMLVDPSTVLTVVGDLGDLVVEVPLTQEMLAYVREGQSVRVSTPALGERAVEATLTRISPFLAGSFSTVGEIDLHGPTRGLLPGMFVTVDVLYGESERATLVPLAAVWEDPRSGERGVWTVDLSRPAAAEGEDAEDAAPRAEPARGGDLSAAAYPVDFRVVRVLAEGGDAAGVSGLDPGTWVVTVGQHLLADREAVAARVRPTTWERVVELQGLQREDLVEGFLAEQQRQARVFGAVPPSNEEYLGGGPGPEPAAGGAAEGG
ncbi:MAG TPA: efflux RND transporter periplasmic adaptor subunit, partial [Thermoanaerobaculia bacterium]|nr:efflux RND transporter periplasmic adaptor subunit [Thermoanaerobaculia bacterium]